MVGSADAAAVNARAAHDSAMYQAAVARNNQIIAGRNADYAIQRGDLTAEVRQMQTGQQMGTARAMMGASGVKLNEGSPVNVQGDIAMMGSMDVETIRNNAMREAYGYKVQGLGFGATAGLDTNAASYANVAGRMNVMSSLVSGASSISDKWSKFKATGTGPTGGTTTTTQSYSGDE